MTTPMTTPIRYRISWSPGQDRLVATCHCRARREYNDPETAWTWLLGHPEDHHPRQPPTGGVTLEMAEAD